MRASIIRVAFRTSFALSFFGSGCIGTVEGGPGIERQESPATADEQDSNPASAAEDGDAAVPAAGEYGNAQPADPGPNPPASNPSQPSGQLDASVPSPTKDAGVAKPPPPPPPAGDPIAESVQRGAGLYPAMCGGCHGANGQGGRGPSLTSPATFEALASKIDSSMPKGNPGACNRTCAEDLSRFILQTFVN